MVLVREGCGAAEHRLQKNKWMGWKNDWMDDDVVLGCPAGPYIPHNQATKMTSAVVVFVP